jgi:hypothetical protein
MTAKVEFPQIFDRCAGLDVHKDSVVATIKINELVNFGLKANYVFCFDTNW